MSIKVSFYNDYARAVKKACLKQNDQLEIIDKVSRDPELGCPISGAGILRKLRVKFQSKRIGTRGGLRVVYYYCEKRREVWLLDVYYKGDKESLTPQETRQLEQLAKSLIQRE
ncbi:MAG: hypothetical protein U5L04_04100 [Trueperaceae bacterium]|nr:hypothetical protein [Trueperaceae bacterium]